MSSPYLEAAGPLIRDVAAVRCACASGAAGTYRHRMATGTGLEFAHVIPGILNVGDVDDLVALVAPRPLLLISATDDRYSADAPDIERAAAPAWATRGASGARSRRATTAATH